MRYISVVLGGGSWASAGAFLSIAQFNMFTPDIIAGRGWAAIALVVFGNWHPGKIFAGALIFGGIDALQPRLQTAGLVLPHQYMLLLPYVITILLPGMVSQSSSAPAALLRAYRREWIVMPGS